MRHESVRRFLGEQALTRVRTAKVLLVGAGGIGCELLKELVVAGFGEIHVVDLDTIDLSNLNRQFLFGQQHVKQSKAEVAGKVASEFNPDVRIIPYVGNIITDEQFSVKFFRSFDIVFNALDNAEARRHVNHICVSTNVLLIDCGSAGFAGQAQVILPHESECYDCRSHPTPNSFPVCTIRSTPSHPIHCVVWSKSFLFALLFGTPDSTTEAEEDNESEDAQRKADERQEENELLDLKSRLHEPNLVARLVQKVYVDDIYRLLLAKQLWQGAHAPEPLNIDVDAIKPVSASSLDDHKPWTPEEALGVLKFSTSELAARLVNNRKEASIEFDKDDEPTLDFVVAATVLRSHVFGILQRSKFDIKQMAGNIIPAVATTNAIVSGLGVIEAFKVLSGAPMVPGYCRDVNIFRSNDKVLLGSKLHSPSPTCPVSSCARATVRAAVDTKLNDLVEQILKLKLGYDEVSLVTDKLIYDPDFEDQLGRTLGELNLANRFVTIVDEDDRRVNLELYIDADEGSASIEIDDDVRIPLKPEIKRSREDDDEEEIDAKRLEINADGEIILD